MRLDQPGGHVAQVVAHVVVVDRSSAQPSTNDAR
jgi:hypothetical protein